MQTSVSLKSLRGFQVRVLDCYLHEGIKVLYRVAMAILLLFHKFSSSQNSDWMREISDHGVEAALTKFCRQMPVRVYFKHRFLIIILTKSFHLNPEFNKVTFSMVWGFIFERQKSFSELDYSEKLFLDYSKAILNESPS